LPLASGRIFGQSGGVSEIPPVMAPVELRVAPRGAALIIAWPDGGAATLAASALRQACRCAACTAARASGKLVACPVDVAITAVAPVGGYAVNIVFSDGHNRGIYPWGLLRELGGA
jgi:DUF971 family protein